MNLKVKGNDYNLKLNWEEYFVLKNLFNSMIVDLDSKKKSRITEHFLFDMYSKETFINDKDLEILNDFKNL